MNKLVLPLLLLLACTVERAERPIAIDTTTAVDTTALDSLLDSLPVMSVETLVTPVPVIDTSLVIVPETTVTVDTTTRPDTTIVVVIDSTPRGIPFGPYGAWDGSSLKPGAGAFSASMNNVQPSNLERRLAVAKARGQTMLVAFAGGDRSQVKTDGVFDPAKYGSVLATFFPLSPVINQAVREGTIYAAIVMDEPFNLGGHGNETNGWGPRGTLTKVRVDSLCAMHKFRWPALAVGVTHDHKDFEPSKSYRVCDFMLSQYRSAKGDVRAFRDSGLALARRGNHAVAFSLNVLDGGIPASRVGKTTWAATDCPLSSTGGRGTYFPNCRMTASQVRQYAAVLGPAGCAFTFWRYDAAFIANPQNAAAFRDVRAALDQLPLKPCQ